MGAPLPPRQGLGCGMMTRPAELSTRPDGQGLFPTTAFRNAVTSASHEQRDKAATAGSGNRGASRRGKQREAAAAWQRRRHLGRRPTAALQAHDLPQATHAGPSSVAQENRSFNPAEPSKALAMAPDTQLPSHPPGPAAPSATPRLHQVW